MKKTGECLRDLKDNKCTNINIIKVPEGEKREQGIEIYLKK